MQKGKPLPKLPDRQAAVAGRFYSLSKSELQDELLELFSKAEKLTDKQNIDDEKIQAIISPHAGYVFSGLVAASAYIHLRERKNIKRIFLIGSSHHAWFEGASIYYEGHYITPLGKVEVDRELTYELMNDHKLFTYHHEAHSNEHSLEVQIPFLQHVLNNNFKIIPIIIGSQSKEIPFQLSEILKSYFNPENLFIISTDLSHYPEYYDAIKVDQLTVAAICSNDPGLFIEQVNETERKRINNLSTSICGWSSVLTLLYMTTSRKDLNYNPVLYQNSGDVALCGEKSRVVGYQSILITSAHDSVNAGFSLSDDEKAILLEHARRSIINNIASITINNDDIDTLPRALFSHFGAFVSIYIQDDLRGCIGRLECDEAIYTTVGKMAIASSTNDSRFQPIQQLEIDKMNIEISILSALHKISSIDEIIPGKHGILIRKDFRSGTFLPQVATHTGWGVEELLSQCSDRKAGLGPNGWKDAEIFIYEAEVFSDK